MSAPTSSAKMSTMFGLPVAAISIFEPTNARQKNEAVAYLNKFLTKELGLGGKGSKRLSILYCHCEEAHRADAAIQWNPKRKATEIAGLLRRVASRNDRVKIHPAIRTSINLSFFTRRDT